jgi:hypothetical protein
MSTSSIIARLDRELAPRGFRRKKVTWNREHDSLVDVIDIQVSKSGNTVTMNAGVLSRPIYFTCWGRESKPFVEEPSCTVRARVGQLLDNKDRWWDIGSESAADEMVECLGALILPFLDRMQSFKAMRDWLTSTGLPSPKWPASSVYFAVLQSQLGDMEGACSTLTELEGKALGAWKAGAKEVAVRIGCDRASIPGR